MVDKRVSIVECLSYEQKEVDDAVRKALALIDFEFGKNVKVLLKPNLIASSTPDKAATTHPSVLSALCKVLKEKDAKIFIGDSSGHSNTAEAFKTSGIERVAREYGAKLLDFDSIGSVELRNGENKRLKRVRIPKLDVDLIINLPKLKTHTFMMFTGAVKNLYGFVVGDQKMHYHRVMKTEKRFAEMLLDLHGFVKPQLTLMDGIIGMEGDGPTGGVPKQTGVILASRDCIALDVVASDLIGYNPKNIFIIKEARKRGLVNKLEKVGILDAKVPYKKPFKAFQQMLPRFIADIIYKKKLRINDRCEACLLCYKKCPFEAIELKKGCPVITSKCFGCCCCQELCPANAVDVMPSQLLVYGRKVFKTMKMFKMLKEGKGYV